MEIIWSPKSLKSLQKIYEFIEEDSPQNATVLIDEISFKVMALIQNVERYNLDKYKKNNTGNYRAFEHKKVRVSYKVEPQAIVIVRVRHTKQRPQNY